MKTYYRIAIIAVCCVCAAPVYSSDRNPAAGVRAGEPNLHQERYGTMETFTYPNPIVLKQIEKIQYFYVRGTTFDVRDVDLETVRVLGKIPPYDGAWVKGDWLITTAFVMRFLGAIGVRPITEDFDATYTVEFDLVGGEHILVEGEFSLVIYPGDLTFDGVINIEDLIFLSDYLYNGGPVPTIEAPDGTVWEVSELLDIDRDGDVDEDDLEALEEILGFKGKWQ